MNAIEEARALLKGVADGLFEWDLEVCFNRPGLVYMDEKFVFLGAGCDPMGEDEHTLAVMFVYGGEDALLRCAWVAERALVLGFRYVCWNRQVKRGDGRLRKEPLEKFVRLCRALYRRG